MMVSLLAPGEEAQLLLEGEAAGAETPSQSMCVLAKMSCVRVVS